ncbi:MAG: S24/S26 family peptidase [Mycobacteriaceae bacterium]
MRAWAGSYTPHGRSQCAVASSDGRTRRDKKPMCPPKVVITPTRVTLLERLTCSRREAYPVAAWRNCLPRRVLVRGPSMSPTLSDGDIVLARMNVAVRSGVVVLVRWSQRPGQLSVKRAVRHELDGQWYVLGDSPDGSTDSRTLGPATVVGVIACRLWPKPARLDR